jgi:hypothetical protein
MKCYCCGQDTPLAHHVKLRGDPQTLPAGGFKSPDDPAYLALRENLTFRSAFVCPGCYAVLDSEDGIGEIAGRTYGLAGRSRGGRAAVYNEAKYLAYQRRLAGEMGIDLQ